MNVDDIALERARKALQNRFDAEAYIVMALAEMRTGQDRVPESTIDENIGGMGDEFVRYMNAKANYRNGKIKKEELLSHLDTFLTYIGKITTELYNSCDCIEEKEKIKTKYQNINSNL